MGSGSSVFRTSAKPTVIFLHIRKTAGSTLNKIIEHQYKRTSIFSLAENSIDEFKKLPATRREKIMVLKGHMHFGAHEFLPRPSIYITMLRDPVDRIISHYYMIIRSPNDVLHNEVVSRRMSLKDFVSSGLTGELENAQTKLLSGVEEADAIGSFEQCSNEMLEIAKKNLQEHFAVVGLSERFDESLILLKRAFGWGNIFYIKQHVGTNRPKTEDIPKEALNLIEKHNELDINLFRYAKEVFDETIRQQGPSFEKELREFQLMNKFYHKVYAKAYGSIYNIFRPMTTGFRRCVKTLRAGNLGAALIIIGNFVDLDAFFNICCLLQGLDF